MKPRIMTDCKKPIYPNPNRTTIDFFFPQENAGSESVTGEIYLIGGDNPQIVVIAPESIQVERVLKKKGG
jgi:hypothetical protein